MANIELAIDVDSSSVASADAALDRFDASLRGTTGAFTGVAGASRQADRGVRGFADASTMAAQRTAQAAAQMARVERATIGLSRGFTVVGQEAGQMVRSLASGQDAVVALGNSLPQMAMAFGAVGLAIGGLLSIGIPLLALWMQSGDEAETLEERTTSLSNASKALIGINGELAKTNRELAATYGQNAEAMRTVLELQASIASADFAQKMRDQVAAISELFGVAERMSTVRNELTGVSEMTQLVGRLTNQAGLARSEAQGLADALLALQSAQGVQQQAGAAQNLADSLARASGGAENLEGKSLEAYRALLDIAKAGYETQTSIDAASGSATGLASATAGARTEAYTLADAWSGVLGQVAAAQAAAARARIELETVGNPIRRAGRLAGAGFDSALGDVKGAIVSPTDLAALAKARQETVKWREEETRLREEAAQLSDFTGKIGRAIEAAKPPTEGVGRAMGGVAGAAKKAAAETAKITEEIEKQHKGVSELVTALRGVAFGTVTGPEGIGGIFSALTEGAFGDKLDEALKDASEKIFDALDKGLSGLGKGAGLSETAVAGVGTGIGIAATGVLTGNSQQIGAGIGSAFGSVAGDMLGAKIGTSIGGSLGTAIGAIGGPLGMVLGGALGGVVSKIFSGGGSSWKTFTGEAFSGTTFATKGSGRINTKNDDATAVGRITADATKNLFKNFERELGQFVRAAGGTVSAEFARMNVKYAKAAERVIGNAYIGGAGDSTKQRAAEISAKVAEIMALAGTIAAKAGPALTNAQVQWRAVQKQFSKANREILEDLGFSAKQIQAKYVEIRTSLARGFNQEMSEALIATGKASKANIDQWRKIQLKALDEQYKAAARTAKDIHGDSKLVYANFQAQKGVIADKYKELLAELTGATVAAVKTFVSWKEKVGFNLETVQGINTVRGGANASAASVQREYVYAIAELKVQRNEQLAEAKRTGQSIYWVNRLFDQKQIEAAETRQAQLLAIAQRGADKIAATLAARMEKLNFADSILGQLATINDGAGLTTKNVQAWYSTQATLLAENHKQMVVDAKRNGLSLVYVEQLYAQQRTEAYRQKLAYLNQITTRGLDKVIEGLETSIGTLTDKLNGLDQQRADVLGELTKRAEEARNAEKTLADARKSLAASDLAPGGPLDLMKTLQAQFNAATKAARGGDAGAATEAASLAQSLLQQGQKVYASGGGYSDLFRSVNSQLAGAQSAFGAGAGRIEKQLDATTAASISEKSTTALLKSNAAIYGAIKEGNAKLDALEKRLASAQQKARVAS